MLKLIIEDINEKIGALEIFNVIHPLCHQVTKKLFDGEEEIGEAIFPACYLADGEFSDLAFESGKNVLYSRRNGEVSVVINEDYEVGCDAGIIRTIPIRYVGMIFKCDFDDAYKDEKQVENIIHAIQQFDNRTLCTTLEFESIEVEVVRYNVNRYEVMAEEFEGLEFEMPFEGIVFSLDLNIIIETDKSCWENFDCSCGGETISICQAANVQNSDGSYDVDVDCGDSLVLPDTTIEIYVNGVLNTIAVIPSVKDYVIDIIP